MIYHVRNFLAVLSMVAFTLGVGAGNEKDALSGLPLRPPAEKTRLLPLTTALSSVGSRVSGGYVLFGVEVLLKKGEEPTVMFPVEPAGDVGTALRDIMRQLPDYEMHVVSAHMIEILPRSARTDSRDLLNLHVANFNATKASAGTILSNPRRFIPELQAQLYPKLHGARGPQPDGGIYSLGWLITVHLQDVTLREILDRVSEATEDFIPVQPPLGWVYKVNSDDTPNIPKNAWRSLLSSPSDWREFGVSARQSK